jgi:hypothetical protein
MKTEYVIIKNILAPIESEHGKILFLQLRQSHAAPLHQPPNEVEFEPIEHLSDAGVDVHLPSQ